MRILLVEDAEDVAQAVAASFARRGDAVDHAVSLVEARAHVAAQDYDVAILDIELPDGSGAALLGEIRAAGKSTLVLMLTARAGIDDRVAALDRGADDYIVKPFDLRELEARVRALARRAQGDSGGGIDFGDLHIDPAMRSVDIAGTPIPLTRREYSLLEILLAQRGRVVPKERIFERMFSFRDEEVGVNAVEIYVARLRRKLEGSRVSIRTLRGLGYQLVAEP